MYIYIYSVYIYIYRYIVYVCIVVCVTSVCRKRSSRAKRHPFDPQIAALEIWYSNSVQTV